jgi:hypothetical protein
MDKSQFPLLILSDFLVVLDHGVSGVIVNRFEALSTPDIGARFLTR